MPAITAILTAYRRPNTICPLVEAIRAQTIPPSQIWVWANDPTAAVAAAIVNAKVDRVVTSSVNAYFHARFALTLTAPTEFVAVFDDDSVPGPQWFENCLGTMEPTPGILGAAGVRLVEPNYATATKHGWHGPSNETVAVDLVGHAWFLRTQWLHYLFAEPAVLGTNGEDIELAARALRLGGVPCYCPPHPPNDRSLWGSTRGDELGCDEFATFRRASHVAERDHIVKVEIAAGWRPLFMRGALRNLECGGLTPLSIDTPSGQTGAVDTKAVQTTATETKAVSSHRTPNTDPLLSAVPCDAQRVLLVGCGDGALGTQLKARQNVVVEAIEPDVSLAAAAQLCLDRVVVGDPVKVGDSFPDSSFDCVVCEAFDRFRHPEHLLVQVRRWLKPDGRFVAVTANVRHHGIIEALIEGRWPNGDGSKKGTGTICRNGPEGAAHKWYPSPYAPRPLRFYTRREIEKLLYRAGFQCADLQPLPGPDHAEWEEGGRPNEVRVGPLHIAGLRDGEAEEYYAAGYLVTATRETVPDYGVTCIVIVTHNQLEYTRQCVESIRERTDEPYELIFVDNGSTDGTVEWLKGQERRAEGGEPEESRESRDERRGSERGKQRRAESEEPEEDSDQGSEDRGQWDAEEDGSRKTADESRDNHGVASPASRHPSPTPLPSPVRVKVITNSENRGFPVAANQGIQIARGNQILLLNNDTIVTTGWLRRMLRALHSDSRIGLVGPCSNYVSGTQQITVSYDGLEGLDGFAWDWGKAHDRIV